MKKIMTIISAHRNFSVYENDEETIGFYYLFVWNFCLNVCFFGIFFGVIDKNIFFNYNFKMEQIKKELKFSIIGAIVTPILFIIVMMRNEYDEFADIAGYVLFFGYFELVFYWSIKGCKNYIRKYNENKAKYEKL